jgi:hypothetical protein
VYGELIQNPPNMDGYNLFDHSGARWLKEIFMDVCSSPFGELFDGFSVGIPQDAGDMLSSPQSSPCGGKG